MNVHAGSGTGVGAAAAVADTVVTIPLRRTKTPDEGNAPIVQSNFPPFCHVTKATVFKTFVRDLSSSLFQLFIYFLERRFGHLTFGFRVLKVL